MGLDMAIYDSNSNSELAYWRKHPDLHGYIVNTFAAGIDECQKIPLTVDDLEKIIIAVTKDELPKTTGFFFGKSLADDRQPTLDKIRRIIDAMEKDPQKKVYYQASW